MSLRCLVNSATNGVSVDWAKTAGCAEFLDSADCSADISLRHRPGGLVRETGIKKGT